MVHVYNCHPFDSQQIVAADEEPELVCSGGGALFVLCAGACKLVVYNLQQEGCPQICRFSSVASVRSISYSALGDYLVTIEEKNGSTYLRAYTNWRYQVEEKSRVGVRLLGHFLKGSTFRSIPKEQMEIIEIPLVELPLCMSCCSLTGDLLVGCPDSVVVFRMKQHVLSEQVSVLDFERILILHIQDWSPSQVALCAGYVAIQTDLEVLVVKLTPAQENTTTDANLDEEAENIKGSSCSVSERDDLLLFPKHLEILGPDARDCGVAVVPEFTGMDAESHGHISVDYVLYRRFVPDFFQDCRAEETRLHSLQLHPMFTDPGSEEPTCVFAFFSLPNAGYMYSLKTVLELVSTYQYPENAQQAVLCDNFLYVITRNALQCFTVRCSAVAARVDDPYIDTNIKACPPFTMEVCALRIQLFIGLRFLCHSGTHIILLTAADVDSKDDVRRSAFKNIFESSMSRPAHGWNLYVITSVSAMQLYREIVEYSKRYESASPLNQSCVHLLCEAHLLLRTALLLLKGAESAERVQLRAAFQENCAHLGDFFSRFDKDCHLALPYYKMSSLTVTDVIKRNTGPKSNYGKGLLHFLRHSLDEESAEELHKEVANTVLEIFSLVEPSQLPHIVSSPWMQKADPDCAIAHLKHLEVSGPRPVSLSLCLASLALRKDDLCGYSQQMDCQPETLQVCGFIEEPKLLLYSRGKTVRCTILARHLRDTQEKLLVAAVIALHQNHKIGLEEANLFFMELCMSVEHESSPQSLVDFWEALLTTTANGSVVQELLFCLTSVYIDRITERNQRAGKAVKTAQDLINSCSHYGLLYPWLRVITPVQFHSDYQDYLQKLQALLCGPTLQVSSILPLMQRISEHDEVGLSLHILCATRQGQHERSISKLLDRCPQALIPYANHELQNEKLYLWWEKMFPELCSRMKTRMDNPVLLSALEETLIVMSKKLTPLKFLDMMPDDGTTAFFLPRLLDCIQKNGHLFGRS